MPLVLWGWRQDWMASVALDQAWRAWWKGEVREAEQWLARVPWEAAGRPELRHAAGWLLWGMGRDREALDRFAALERHPYLGWSARIGQAVAWEGLGDTTKAMTIWADLADEYAWCAVASAQHARHLELAERWEAAREAYRRALTHDGSLAGLHEKIARMDLHLENYEEAYHRFQTVLAMNPDHSPVKEEVALLLAKIPDYPRQLEMRKTERRQGRAPFKMVPFKGQGGPMLRVGIAEHLSSVTVVCGVPLVVREASSKRLVQTVKAGHPATFRVPLKTSLRLISSDARFPITVYDVAHGAGMYWTSQQDRSYRGTLDLVSEGKTFSLVNRVSLEEYLYGVLPAEMGPGAPDEALKAQAVIARSYLLRRRGAHRRFDVCDDVHCVVYHGVGSEHSATSAAVDATRGRVLLDGARPALAFFHDSCGGHTRAPRETWSGAVDASGGVPDGQVPRSDSPTDWLTWMISAEGLACSWRSPTTSFIRWQRRYTRDDLETVWGKELNGPLMDVVITPLRDTGIVERVEARTADRARVWQGDTEVRRAFGYLRSRVMVVIPRRVKGRLEELFIFGRGWGHGVGLCQRGAMGLAQQGWTYQEILAHYFPSLKLGRWP